MQSPRQKEKAPAHVFVAASVMIFFLSLSAADSIGFVPNYIDGSSNAVTDEVALSDLPELGDQMEQNQMPTIRSAEAEVSGVAPDHLHIDAIDLDLAVQNPETRDLMQLDTLLQKGPARYVDSALLGPKGNVIIFAHSSHLPIVHNQMYRAFNRIPELKSGDSITVSGGGKTYVYSVVRVRRADANEDTIDLSSSEGNRLTLVTCDTLSAKSARWVLEAEFVGSYDS